MIRLAHLSDIHLTADRLEWRRQDWFNKRLAAWINFRCLGRRRRFRHGDEVLAKLGSELQDFRPDRLIFSGDATALGFESELRQAAELLQVASLPGLAVPGNHDYCTPAAAASGLFERYFAPWQQGQRLDGAVYPFAQRVGHVWLIGVNTATGNRWAWDASGAAGPEQLERLDKLLASLEPGPRILVTHYPVCLASGKREARSHGLRDLPSVVQVAARGGVCLWLHGHRHSAYCLQSQHAPFPIICAGSATQTGLWSYGQYSLEGNELEAQTRVFDPLQGCFRPGRSFSLTLA